MSHLLDQLPEPLAAYVSVFAARRRRAIALRRIGAAVAIVTAWSLAWALVDRAWPMPAGVRGGVAVAGVMIVFGYTWAIVARWRRRTDWVAVAGDIERSEGEFQQRLQTVISEYARPVGQRGSAEMIAALAARSADIASGAAQPTLPGSRSLSQIWIVALLLLGLVASLSTIEVLGMRRLMGRQWLFWRHAAPVTITYLDIMPGSATVSRGEALVVLVRTANLAGPAPTIRVSEDGVRWTTAPMRQDRVEGYTYTIASVQRDFQYTIKGGDAAAGPFEVTVRAEIARDAGPAQNSNAEGLRTTPRDGARQDHAASSEEERKPYGPMLRAYFEQVGGQEPR